MISLKQWHLLLAIHDPPTPRSVPAPPVWKILRGCLCTASDRRFRALLATNPPKRYLRARNPKSSGSARRKAYLQKPNRWTFMTFKTPHRCHGRSMDVRDFPIASCCPVLSAPLQMVPIVVGGQCSNFSSSLSSSSLLYLPATVSQRLRFGWKIAHSVQLRVTLPRAPDLCFVHRAFFRCVPWSPLLQVLFWQEINSLNHGINCGYNPLEVKSIQHGDSNLGIQIIHNYPVSHGMLYTLDTCIDNIPIFQKPCFMKSVAENLDVWMYALLTPLQLVKDTCLLYTVYI